MLRFSLKRVGSVIPIIMMTIPATCRIDTVSLNKMTETMTAMGSSMALRMEDLPKPTFGIAIENKKTGMIIPNKPNAIPYNHNPSRKSVPFQMISGD